MQKKACKVLDPMKYAFDPIGEELSACDFRAALESGELATAKFLMNGVSPEDVLDILGIKGETEEVNEHIALPIFSDDRELCQKETIKSFLLEKRNMHLIECQQKVKKLKSNLLIKILHMTGQNLLLQLAKLN